MVSIYTGLAFMHGHIVDRELVLRLGREQPAADGGKGTPAAALAAPGKGRPTARRPALARPACASC